jgi:hypothetical protein
MQGSGAKTYRLHHGHHDWREHASCAFTDKQPIELPANADYCKLRIRSVQQKSVAKKSASTSSLRDRLKIVQLSGKIDKAAVAPKVRYSIAQGATLGLVMT